MHINKRETTVTSEHPQYGVSLVFRIRFVVCSNNNNKKCKRKNGKCIQIYIAHKHLVSFCYVSWIKVPRMFGVIFRTMAAAETTTSAATPTTPIASFKMT